MAFHGFPMVFLLCFQRTGFQRTGNPLIFIVGHPSMNIHGFPSMKEVVGRVFAVVCVCVSGGYVCCV